MKKKITIISLLLIIIIGVPVVCAKEYDDIFYSSNNVKIEGEKNHAIFASGRNVTIDSIIDGMVFTTGSNVAIKGSQDYVLATGLNINLENAGAKEIFISGKDINIKNSELRDVFIAAKKITLESSKIRNVYVSGDKVVIDSTIEGNVKVNASRIIVTENAIITGTLEYPKNTNVDISKEAQISNTKIYAQKITKKEIRGQNASDLFFSGISMVVIAILLLLMNKSFYKKIETFDKDISEIITTMILGVGFLILIPIIVLILCLTGIGFSLGTIIGIFYILLFYLSAIPTSYYVGKWIIKDKINDYSILAISILVLYILRMIPVVGKLLCFASLIFGLGYYTKTVYRMIRKENRISTTLKEKIDK